MRIRHELLPRSRSWASRSVAAASLCGLGLLAPAAATALPVPESAPPSELILAGVSTHGATDAWAVGGYEQGTYPPVTEHWDGTTWTEIPAPQHAGASMSTFSSVVDMGSSSAWASGDYYLDGSPHALLEKWNGTSWTQVVDAVPGDAVAADLEAVASPDPADVWAAGLVDMSESGGGFLEHWNGHTWKALKLAKQASEFTGLTFDSATDGWAVGSGKHGTAAYHWDGTRWSFVPSPSPGSKYDEGFRAVTGLSPNDAWAVGDYSDAEHQRLVPYVEHWDGTAWTVVDTPVPGSGRELLLGLTGVSATDVWAVGSYSKNRKSVSVIEHWNGVDWEVVKSPHPSIYRGLNGVSATTATDVWAVGVNESTGGPHPFIEHWNGTRWSTV